MVKIQQGGEDKPLVINIPKEVERKFGLKKGRDIGFALVQPEALTDEMIVIKINNDSSWVF